MLLIPLLQENLFVVVACVACAYGAYSRTCTLSSKATYGERGGLLSQSLPCMKAIPGLKSILGADTRRRWLPPTQDFFM